MLQETQRTSAPRSVRVSIRTAVWTVMWSEPMILAPASGFFPRYSDRRAIKPGISCSASRISWRPKSPRERSLTLNGSRPASRAAANGCWSNAVVVTLPPSLSLGNGLRALDGCQHEQQRSLGFGVGREGSIPDPVEPRLDRPLLHRFPIESEPLMPHPLPVVGPPVRHHVAHPQPPARH